MMIRPTVVDRMTKLRRQVRRSLSLPGHEIALAVEALLLLAAARILLLMPFARAMRLMGLESGTGRPGSSQAEEAVTGVCSDIRIAVRRASRAAPFRAVCLSQAVAAHLMLRRRRRASEIHFGVVREADGTMSAHAWNCCLGRVVTGMEGMAKHIPIAVFAPGAEMALWRNPIDLQNSRKKS